MSFDTQFEELISAMDRIADNLPTESGRVTVDLDTDDYNMFSFIAEQINSCADQQELIRNELKTLNQNFENLNSILLKLVDKSQ
jgi:hypothetical protein